MQVDQLLLQMYEHIFTAFGLEWSVCAVPFTLYYVVVKPPIVAILHIFFWPTPYTRFHSQMQLLLFIVVLGVLYQENTSYNPHQGW